jgi:hypothetical protein
MKQKHGHGGWSGKRGEGRGIKIVREALAYQGDECILWPMSRDWHGYGMFSYLGERGYVHRYICEQVKGPAPADKPYATHSCGNGHNGCITPRHLSWGTPTGNQLESVAHGRGRKVGVVNKKLTDDHVADIRILLPITTQAAIASMYGVKAETISQIKRGVARRPGPRIPSNRNFAPEVRAKMVVRAKELRGQGVSYYNIGVQIGVSRLTAKAMINE